MWTKKNADQHGPRFSYRKKTEKHCFSVSTVLYFVSGSNNRLGLAEEAGELGDEFDIADLLIGVDEGDRLLAAKCILDDVPRLGHRIDIVFAPLVSQHPAVLGEDAEVLQQSKRGFLHHGMASSLEKTVTGWNYTTAMAFRQENPCKMLIFTYTHAQLSRPTYSALRKTNGHKNRVNSRACACV